MERRPGERRSLGMIHKVKKLMFFFLEKERVQGQDHCLESLKWPPEAGVALYRVALWQGKVLLVGNFQGEEEKNS